MVDEVDLDKGLNDIIEVEIFKVVICGDVQLFNELVLQLEIPSEFLGPTEGPTHLQHEVREITDLDEAGTL